MAERTGTTLRIHDGSATVEAVLDVPPGAAGVVIFAHGTGSGRHSPRNLAVAQVLREAGLATVLADLLTPDEDSRDEARFDIHLLSHRLIAVTNVVAERRELADFPVGYFGGSTGAAAAIEAAAALSTTVGAVVSRGGRPDLALAALTRVEAPTLLIVGERDAAVLRLNRIASQKLRCHHDLAIVPGAGHLFEEPGTLDQVARLAADWFVRFLPARATRDR